MKRLYPASLLALLAMLGCTRAAAASEPTAWEPAAMVHGTPYHKVEELRSFYKLTTGSKSSTKGAYAMSNADVAIELGPGARDLRIGGLQLMLSCPLQKDASGNWLISREDWVSLIDPILRPTYIAGRETVSTVVIDPGHGGHDTGTTTPQLKEAEVTLQVARKLKAELEKLGYKVLLTRGEDMFLSDQQRVEIANSAGAGAIFLSLHVNSGRSDFQGSGIYTLAPGTDARPGHTRQADHAALAYALQSAMVARAGAADAGCKRAHFSLLSTITCPAAWVELGYATHAQEGAALASPAYQDTLAQALAQGVAAYARVADPAARIPTQEPPPAPAKQASTATKSQAAGASSGSSTARTPARQPQRSSSTGTTTNTRKQTSSTPSRSTTAGKAQSTGTKQPQSTAGKAQSSGTKQPQSTATKTQSTKPQSSSPRRQQPPASGRTRR